MVCTRWVVFQVPQCMGWDFRLRVWRMAAALWGDIHLPVSHKLLSRLPVFRFGLVRTTSCSSSVGMILFLDLSHWARNQTAAQMEMHTWDSPQWKQHKQQSKPKIN